MLIPLLAIDRAADWVSGFFFVLVVGILVSIISLFIPKKP